MLSPAYGPVKRVRTPAISCLFFEEIIMIRSRLFEFFVLVCISITLFGCAAQRLSYEPKTVKSFNEAVFVIEQVFYEQPQRYRPDGVVVSNSYLGISLGSGSVSTGAGVVTGSNNAISNASTLESANINNRIYYNSIGDIFLFKKRDWFIVQIIRKDGTHFRSIYTREKHKAEALVDSLYYCINNS